MAYTVFKFLRGLTVVCLFTRFEGYAGSDVHYAVKDLLEAFDSQDEEAFGQIICQPLFKYMDNEVSMTIIIAFFYIALFQLSSNRFTVYYYPLWSLDSFSIQHSQCTFPLPLEHSSQSPFHRYTHANSTTITVLASHRVPI